MTSQEEDDNTNATCNEIGRQAKNFYSDKPWEEVEPLAKRVWESQHTNTAWESVAPRVRLVFKEPET